MTNPAKQILPLRAIANDKKPGLRDGFRYRFRCLDQVLQALDLLQTSDSAHHKVAFIPAERLSRCLAGYFPVNSIKAGQVYTIVDNSNLCRPDTSLDEAPSHSLRGSNHRIRSVLEQTVNEDLPPRLTVSDELHSRDDDRHPGQHRRQTSQQIGSKHVGMDDIVLPVPHEPDQPRDDTCVELAPHEGP